MRVVHELSQMLGRDVLLGSTSLETPESFMDTLFAGSSTLAQLPVLLLHRYIHVVGPAVAAAVPFPRALLAYAAILMAALQDV
eukprot:792644-Pelagomonas_calceolata.AAC.2